MTNRCYYSVCPGPFIYLPENLFVCSPSKRTAVPLTKTWLTPTEN